MTWLYRLDVRNCSNTFDELKHCFLVRNESFIFCTIEEKILGYQRYLRSFFAAFTGSNLNFINHCFNRSIYLLQHSWRAKLAVSPATFTDFYGTMNSRVLNQRKLFIRFSWRTKPLRQRFTRHGFLENRYNAFLPGTNGKPIKPVNRAIFKTKKVLLTIFHFEKYMTRQSTP